MSLLSKKKKNKYAEKRIRQQAKAKFWETTLKEWMQHKNKRICFLDGSCLNSLNGKAVGHGPGGAAAVYYPDYKLSKYESQVTGLLDTTNNVMELTAFECGIQLLSKQFPQDKDKEWIFLTDSEYAYNQLEEKQNASSNVELIQRLVQLKKEAFKNMQLKSLEIHQLPGHSKIKGNETANTLASAEAERWRVKRDRHDSSDDDDDDTVVLKKQKLE